MVQYVHMIFFRPWIVTFGLVALIFYPTFVNSAGVGFVPSTNIWYSPTTISPGESVRLYTVVVNTEYAFLNGTIGFYADDDLIEAVTLRGLIRDHAEQLRVLWKPSEGSYTLTARFITAFAFDDAGRRVDIALDTINRSESTPLSVGNVGSATAVSDPLHIEAPSDEITEYPIVDVVVGGEGETLTIVSPTREMRQRGGTTTLSATIDLPPTENKTELFVSRAVEAVTNTTAATTRAYHSIRAFVHDVWKSLTPSASRAWSWWRVLTNNNNPKHIGIVLASLTIFLGVVRLTLRRRGEDE